MSEELLWPGPRAAASWVFGEVSLRAEWWFVLGADGSALHLCLRRACIRSFFGRAMPNTSTAGQTCGHPICVAVICRNSSLEKEPQWYRDIQRGWTFRELLHERVLCTTAQDDQFLDKLRKAGHPFEGQQLVVSADTLNVTDDLGNAVALDTRLHELEVAFHDAQYTVVIQGVSTS